eukprot:TRINITY_DN7769_c0_g1_i1.p2 TRINITY_DN7769_c0_g1~~TRINITY_DN7769_c0_g1_i1.p2  ORF type:complete len:265 (+),score=74.61 TRINITY_DN7769_c0_g1_i1:118-912(+)
MTDETKICKFYRDRGTCKKGDECEYSHAVGGGKKGGGKGGKGKKKAKNTEEFDPCHEPTDMRVRYGDGRKEKYGRELFGNEVVVVQGMFGEEDDMSTYEKLVTEMEATGIKTADLWKQWHNDSHWIADDKMNWKDTATTFKSILDRISTYFSMDIKATRFNFYKDSEDWKPYHHDAAAVKPDKAKIQNFTVAISFGAERDASFEHAATKTTVSFPLPNGSVYCFSKDVNVEWKHGILQLPPEMAHKNGRVSIIAWGWVDMKDKR